MFYPSMKGKEEPAEELTEDELTAKAPVQEEYINAENPQEGVLTGAAAAIKQDDKVPLKDLLLEKLQNAPAPFSTVPIFYKNYKDMKKTNVKKADKYFHAKANCQIGQKRDIDNAILLDLGKEVYDILKKNGFDKNGKSLKENLQDSKEDIYADLYGLKQGVMNPKIDCRYLINRPKDLDEKY